MGRAHTGTSSTRRRTTGGEAADLVRSIVASGTRAAGARLIVSLGGDVLVDLCAGETRPGRTMRHDTVHSLFCLTKPIVATVAVAVADERGVPLDDDMRTSSPRIAEMAGDRRVVLRDVLSHSAGVHTVLAPQVMFLPRPERAAACNRLVFADGWRTGVDHAYADFQAWNVLRVWLEDVTGEPFSRLLRARLTAAGLDDLHFGVGDDEWAAVSDRIGVNYDVIDGQPRPMPHELLRKHLDDPAMQSIGGHGSAAALARFYELVLGALHGSAPRGFPGTERMREMVTPTAPPAVDPVLTSTLSFGLGFMTDLTEALSPSIGARAFGHLGLLGHAFAFADPDIDLVAAYVPNGFLVADGGRFATRASIVDAIYRDLEDAG